MNKLSLSDVFFKGCLAYQHFCRVGSVSKFEMRAVCKSDEALGAYHGYALLL